MVKNNMESGLFETKIGVDVTFKDKLNKVYPHFEQNQYQYQYLKSISYDNLFQIQDINPRHVRNELSPNKTLLC